MRRHLPGDAHQRYRIHQRVGQRRHHVGGARPRRHQHHAGQTGGARIALGGVAGALLVPHQDMLDLVLLEQLVIDREHRTTRIAEEMFDAMIDQRAHDHGGAGHLVRIVAVVAHSWLRTRCLSAASSVGFWRTSGPFVEQPSRSIFLFEHDLLGKPVLTFPDHALGNKKGPKRPHAHRPIVDGLAIPGGAPGYDDDKEFGNFITHLTARLPKGCAEHSARSRKVKGR